MKLLINICSHDGIISHYNGVGTMTIRYIKTFTKICRDLNIKYDLNLFTPEYDNNSFGYNEELHNTHSKLKNTHIFQVSNGSNKKINYGTINNWKELCKNTSNIINSIDKSHYDKVLTICNDTPFCCLINELNNEDNHIKVLILHSSIKIHKTDSAVTFNSNDYNDRLNWEINGINYINKNNNCFVGTICNYFEKHLINEYKLNKKKVLRLYNGELFSNKKRTYNKQTKEIFKEINKYNSIIISFGRAEEYKNLEICFELGNLLNIKPIVISQLYYKGQPIEKTYKKLAKKYNGLLYIDPPFDLAKYVLNKFNGNIICLIPSKEEIMGLIVNEVRKINNERILIVANKKGGLVEQIKDTYDGILVDLNDLEKSKDKIEKYFNEDDMKRMTINSNKTLKEKYDFYKNAKIFIEDIIRR